MLKITMYKLLGSIMSILLIFMLINKAIIPFDKVLLPIMILFLLFTNDWRTSKNIIIITFATLLYLFLISFINIGENDPMVFMPALFIIAGVLGSSNKYINVINIKRALFVNILFGVVMVIVYYAGFENNYTASLAEKGLPFIKSPIGFSPTIQVYGTCCIIWLFLAFESDKQNVFALFLVAIILLSTLNRASMLMLIVLLFCYRRKILYVLISIITICCIVFFDIIYTVLFNSATLSSRVQLRYGAALSYWNTDDILILLFGRANHQTSQEIAHKTIWEREYIENGLDFIAHSYGLLGLLMYVLLLFIFVGYLFNRKHYNLALITTIYMTFIQYITNEFLSSSMMFFIMSIIIISNRRIQDKKL